MSFPLSFTSGMRGLLPSDSEAFFESLLQPSPVSIRINSYKVHDGLTLGDRAKPVLWSRQGYYLPYRPVFTLDPLFQAGVYYVQEASSMFLEQAVRQYISPDTRVLDMCAAPGGKTVLLASMLSEQGVLVSNEVIASRANTLLENVQKSGFSNVVVTSAHATDFADLGAVFDAVVVDAPCSGEGMFRKDANAVKEWSDKGVELCVERQQTILRNAWMCLKEGGVLIYSTCTYNTSENEENIFWMMQHFGAEVLPVQVEDDWGIASSLVDKVPYAYRFFPHRVEGEGFFMALLRKPESTTSVGASEKKRGKLHVKNSKKISGVKNIVQDKSPLRDGKRFVYEEIRGVWRAYPFALSEFLPSLHRIKILNAGIKLGEVKGKILVPSHTLALSVELERGVFVEHELDEEMAVSFFRRESLSLSDVSKGYVLLTYMGVGLGFVKNLGSRSNSLLPLEWRIRMSATAVDDGKGLSVFRNLLQEGYGNNR